MKKKYLSLALLLVLAASLFCFFPAVPTVRAHNPVWWDFDWNQRLEYTVNATLITADLVDFPVLVYVDSDLVNWGDIQNNLDDIRFTGDYLDELSFEIDYFVLNDEAWFWVRLPEVSSSLDTYFFMYFDNKFCTSGEDAEAVWDEYTVMVQHMNDETTSTILDSTSNDNDGTKKAANTPIEVTENIGKAQSFLVGNEYIRTAHSETLDDFASITLRFWLYVDATGYQIIINKWWATEGAFQVYTAAGLIYWVVNPTGSGTLSASKAYAETGQWAFIVCTWDKTDKAKIYVNNVQGTDSAASGNFNLDGDAASFVDVGATASSLIGKVDEFVISKDIVRSSAWVGASYETQRLNLLIVGGHEHPPDLTLRGEFIAAALVASLILVPLLILIIFAARRKR